MNQALEERADGHAIETFLQKTERTRDILTLLKDFLSDASLTVADLESELSQRFGIEGASDIAHQIGQFRKTFSAHIEEVKRDPDKIALYAMIAAHSVVSLHMGGLRLLILTVSPLVGHQYLKRHRVKVMLWASKLVRDFHRTNVREYSMEKISKIQMAFLASLTPAAAQFEQISQLGRNLLDRVNRMAAAAAPRSQQFGAQILGEVSSAMGEISQLVGDIGTRAQTAYKNLQCDMAFDSL